MDINKYVETKIAIEDCVKGMVATSTKISEAKSEYHTGVAVASVLFSIGLYLYIELNYSSVVALITLLSVRLLLFKLKFNFNKEMLTLNFEVSSYESEIKIRNKDLDELGEPTYDAIVALKVYRAHGLTLDELKDTPIEDLRRPNLI